MNGISVRSVKVELRTSASSAVTTTECEQSVPDWNQGELAKSKCVHGLFQEQAKRTPDAFAVIDGDCSLSYRELNDGSNQLAYCLRELGVGPEKLVAICLERSLELIVGLLRILKAGGGVLADGPGSH
jgi:non-ribosomal peptide synthetase component F